jgi:hypothetical protein
MKAIIILETFNQRMLSSAFTIDPFDGRYKMPSEHLKIHLLTDFNTELKKKNLFDQNLPIEKQV